MLKQNALKLLLIQYIPENNLELGAALPWNVDQLSLVVPELSPAGFKSVMYSLGQRQYVRSLKTAHQQEVSLTSHGRKVVEAAFPAFHARWRRSGPLPWHGLIFSQAPATDKQFRYLRQLLISQGGVALTRGVYIYPGPWPARVNEELEAKYIRSVVGFTIDAWTFGDEMNLLGQLYHLQDTFHIYSGISREIDQLISKVSAHNGWEHQTKASFTMLFHRFYEVLTQDVGLVGFYFPQEKFPLSLLQKIQTLSKL